MEAKLFFVSIWCGLYGLLLRGVKKWNVDQNIWVPMFMNGLFWGTAGFLVGMLVSSYRVDVSFSFTTAIQWIIGGFLIGLSLGFWNGKEEKRRSHLLRDNLEWADTGFSAILLASVVMFFVVQAFKIPSGSMRMTFVEGDHLFVNKFIYGIRIPFTYKKVFPFRQVQNGDIVIFRFPSDDKDNPQYGKDFIKRVLAVQGQTVQVKNKNVFVDGKGLIEPYKQNVDPNTYVNFLKIDPKKFQDLWEKAELSNAGSEIRDNFGPVAVPNGCVFVMGDNRDRSFDSRFWGPLPLSEIKGKAWLKYWGPIDPEKLKKNFWLRFWPVARVRLVN